MTRVAEMARHNTEEIKRRKNSPPPGSVGAQRVPREAFDRQRGDPRYPENKPKSRKKKVKVVMGTSVATRPISWLWPIGWRTASCTFSPVGPVVSRRRPQLISRPG